MAQVTLQARAFRGKPKTKSSTKDIADLIVEKGTNEAGKVTNPEVYNVAISFLKGGREVDELDFDIQKKIAGYENDLKSLSNRKANAKRSLDDFKRIEDSVLFNNLDDEFRDPWKLLESTILEKDRILLDVLDAIESKSANDEDTDNLESYANELSQTIDELDDFRSQLANKEFTSGKMFDTFTYVVQSNPDGLGIGGAAWVPTRLLPKGFQRTNKSVSMNGAYAPVAIPWAIDKRGKRYGFLGGNIYKSSSDTEPLKYRSEKPGTFNMLDVTLYPKKKSGIENGAYVQGTLGYDDEGEPIMGILKKGDDGKLYSIEDKGVLEQLKSSPTESQKLEGYIETLNAKEFSELYNESEPFNLDLLQSFLPQPNIGAGGTALQVTSNPATEFFAGRVPTTSGAVNRPTTPAEPVISKSTPDIIDKGKSFFRKTADFFAGRSTYQNPS